MAFFASFEKTCFNWTAQFSSEVDPGCLAVLRHRFPRLQHIGGVRALDIAFWRGILFANSGQFDAVVLAGGSPCQQISAASCSSEGLSGKDSGLFWEFARIAGDLDIVCREHNRPLWRLFENVPGARGTVQAISDSLGFAPVHVDAADFGWCSRKRLIWCDAFLPDEWRCFVDTGTYATQGWHTLSIPRRRRRLPPIGSF